MAGASRLSTTSASWSRRSERTRGRLSRDWSLKKGGRNACFVFLFVRLVVEAIRAIVYKAPTVKPKPLCVECSYAHVQYGAKGQRAVSCTYGGMVRP